MYASCEAVRGFCRLDTAAQPTVNGMNRAAANEGFGFRLCFSVD